MLINDHVVACPSTSCVIQIRDNLVLYRFFHFLPTRSAGPIQLFKVTNE